ncbi:hypothetical protein N9948_01835 [bacterium]|nr:hypothetical protein [bacterium]
MLRGNGLNLKFKTKDLISKIKENRTRHHEDYNLAVEQYKEELQAQLKKMLADAIKGDEVPHLVPLEKPEQHLREYDTALDIFEMTSQKEVELDQTTFKQLVRDEWAWKDSFDLKTMGYANARK